MRRGATMNGKSCVVMGRRGVGPVRFRGALFGAAAGEQRVHGLVPPRAPDVGVVRLVLPGVRVRPWAVCGGV